MQAAWNEDDLIHQYVSPQPGPRAIQAQLIEEVRARLINRATVMPLLQIIARLPEMG
jgi:hypothetical protein